MKAEIFGATWCTYCTQAKKLCEANGIEYTYLDVEDGDNLQLLEGKIGKIKTVPQIFLDGKFIPGGFTGLKQELKKS